MRQLFALLFPMLVFAAELQGQSVPAAPQLPAKSSAALADEKAWDGLTQLTPDSKLAIEARGRTFRCEDLHVTSNMLYCEIRPVVQSPLFYREARPIEFQRSEVESVHHRHPTRIRWIGYGAATAAGIAFGASRSSPTSDNAERAAKGLTGAVLFDLVAIPFVEVAAQLSSGKAVYRRP